MLLTASDTPSMAQIGGNRRHRCAESLLISSRRVPLRWKSTGRWGGGAVATSVEKNKTTAGLLAILLGAFGVHKFYLGDTTAGAITLAISLGAGLVTCGAATFMMSIIGIVERIIYLSKLDSEFQQIYVLGRKS